MYEINTFGRVFKVAFKQKYLKQINLILKDMIYARKIFYNFLKKTNLNIF